ncbi:hypothetical protein N566_16240 [Streptomycetaceae bacterium MP113-05]|nr:hypothetical protein N566_16240 [Streptomycetaceae bacterium MP113-05]
MVSVAKRTRNRFGAPGSWALLGALLLALTAFLTVRTAVGLGALGEGGHIIAAHCIEKRQGRGDPYTACEGSLVTDEGVTHGQPVKVRLSSAEEGDSISVHRTPWGTYEAVDDSVLTTLGQGLLLMLLSAAVTGSFLRAWILLRRTAPEPAENR